MRIRMLGGVGRAPGNGCPYPMYWTVDSFSGTVVYWTHLAKHCYVWPCAPGSYPAPPQMSSDFGRRVVSLHECRPFLGALAGLDTGDLRGPQVA